MGDRSAQSGPDGLKTIPEWLLWERAGASDASLSREWSEIGADRSSGPGAARLATAMLLLRSERPSRPLLARANARALRWVDGVIRRSRAAEALRQATPNMSLLFRCRHAVGRLAWSLAAVFVLMICRSSILGGLEAFGRGGTELADKLQSYRDSFGSV